MVERQKCRPQLSIEDWENPRKVVLFVLEALQGGIPVVSGKPFTGEGVVVLEGDTTKWDLRYHELQQTNE